MYAIPFSSKTAEMKEMDPTRPLQQAGLCAQQGSPDESEKESLRPQPLGCKKTAIIR